MGRGGFWFMNILAGQSAPFTPDRPIYLKNASLGLALPDNKTHGDLLLEVDGVGRVPIARFQRFVCEQHCLSIKLEAGTTYLFVASGPFPIDLSGSYIPTSTPSIPSASAPDVAPGRPSTKRKGTPTQRFSSNDGSVSPPGWHSARASPGPERRDEEDQDWDDPKYEEEEWQGVAEDEDARFSSTSNGYAEEEGLAYDRAGTSDHQKYRDGYQDGDSFSDEFGEESWDASGSHRGEEERLDEGDDFSFATAREYEGDNVNAGELNHG